jgi:tetratricopeptide (TPR) repeat protein
MKLYKVFFITLILCWLFTGCGGNPEAEGDNAYANGKYKRAINHYLEVKKSQPENTKINEKIALAHMQQGLKLYKRTKNIKTFTGNFEMGLNFVPEENTGSPEFKQEYSQILFHLACAYYKAKPSNEIQREQYFTKTLDNLDEAIMLDQNNTRADSMLFAIKTANFQKMYNKGIKFYEQAKKEKTNDDLYLSAERYLNRAVSFDPESEEAIKSLKLVRTKTLRILDTDKDFPFGVAAMQRKSKFLLIDFAGVNILTDKITFDPAKLKLIDEDDNEYLYNKEQTEKYDNGITKPVPLEPRKQINGILYFPVAKSVKLKCLVYEMDDGVKIRKYFP